MGSTVISHIGVKGLVPLDADSFELHHETTCLKQYAVTAQLISDFVFAIYSTIHLLSLSQWNFKPQVPSPVTVSQFMSDLVGNPE